MLAILVVSLLVVSWEAQNASVQPSLIVQAPGFLILVPGYHVGASKKTVLLDTVRPKLLRSCVEIYFRYGIPWL